MKLLVAPQELKGTLTAAQAAHAMARGLSAFQLDLAPLADGGPGTLDALASMPGAQRRSAVVADPLGRPVNATWLLLADGTAVVEMAQASGLSRLAPEERDPTRASTSGTGALVRAALDAGCARLWLAVGGSATVDGGRGALEALGARCDASGVDLSGLHGGLRRVPVEVLADVDSPLLGPHGAARLFGPQKGATASQVEQLEEALTGWSEQLLRATGRQAAALPGAGAAGGLAFAFAALGASIVPGFTRLAALLELPRRIAQADWVLTAEGRFDAQTARGKGPLQLAHLARAASRPIALFTGSVAQGAPREAFTEVVTLPATDASAAERLTLAAERWGHRRALTSTER